MKSLRRLGLLSSRSIFSNVRPTTIIGSVRYAGTEAAAAVAPASAAPTPTTSAPAGVPIPAITQEQRFSRPGYRPRAVPPPGHAERIWVYHHILDNFTVYSLTQEMKATKAYRQLMYTGKKFTPAKLRKDYWWPLAVVEFGEGMGNVGRSVFQKLRELKKRHLLEWDDPALLHMSRHDRGRALNDQRGTFVADLAFILAGGGKGNLMVKRGAEAGAAAAPEEERRVDKKEKGSGGGGGRDANAAVPGGLTKVPVSRLHQATVYWANEQDKYYAREWSDNVTHVIGLPEKGVKKAKEQAATAEEGVEEEEKKVEAAETPKAEE